MEEVHVRSSDGKHESVRKESWMGEEGETHERKERVTNAKDGNDAPQKKVQSVVRVPADSGKPGKFINREKWVDNDGMLHETTETVIEARNVDQGENNHFQQQQEISNISPKEEQQAGRLNMHAPDFFNKTTQAQHLEKFKDSQGGGEATHPNIRAQAPVSTKVLPLVADKLPRVPPLVAADTAPSKAVMPKSGASASEMEKLHKARAGLERHLIDKMSKLERAELEDYLVEKMMED